MSKLEELRQACKGTVNRDNANSVLVALEKYGATTGLDQPHRYVHFMSQLIHESGSFKWDRELWGPTDAQKRYERDMSQPWARSNPRNKLAFNLGNSEKGDGKKFAGNGPNQLTGRANHRAFTVWARTTIDPKAPDFEANPDLINTDPWEGLSAIWYWSIGNPTGKSLNIYADQNNAEMITRRINGGLNGYQDRLDNYDRLGLVMLGYGPTEYKRFQENAKATGEYSGTVDGEPGPKTRAAIHMRLVKMTAKPERDETVQTAPVVEEKNVAVPVPELEKPWYKSPEVLIPTVTPVLPGLAGFDWRVMIGAMIIGAAFGAYLIYRRSNMKSAQVATVAAIEKKAI